MPSFSESKKGRGLRILLFKVPSLIMNNKDTDLDSMITTFNTAVTETASEILGKQCQEKIPRSRLKFLICVTKGENGEKNDLNLKDLRHTRK